MRHNPYSEVVKHVVGGRLWGERPLGLVDVGVSGGIAVAWDAFQPLISAVGFDPLVMEIERLRRDDLRDYVRYEAAFVDCHGERRVPASMTSIRIDPYARTSSQRAQDLMSIDYVKEQFNSGAVVQWSDRHVAL